MTPIRPWRAAAALGFALLTGYASIPASTAAQSTLERTPNLSGGWIGENALFRFHFLHRFEHSGAPERQVGNRPTFLLGYTWAPVLLGAHYATRSGVERGIPNEWELFARTGIGGERRTRIAVTAAYNAAARAPDGEVTGRTGFGRIDGLGVVRVLGGGDARVAVGGGVVVRLTQYAAATFDATSLVDRAAGEDVAWGAGLQLALPRTPHTFSLQATNTNSATLRGSTIGEQRVRYGFEFTVPLTLRRYLGGARPPSDVATSGDDLNGAPRIEPTLFARIRGLEYAPDSITVPAGTTIVWTNEDPLEHTVTARDRSWDSGDIAPGASWRRRFDEPGRYEFFCLPHPFMTGVVIVE
jgi:plastocyanin